MELKEIQKLVENLNDEIVKFIDENEQKRDHHFMEFVKAEKEGKELKYLISKIGETSKDTKARGKK